MHETDSTAGPLPGAAGAATLSALLMAGVQVLLLDVSPVGRSAPDLFWVGCLAALAVAATSYAPRAVLAVGALVSLGFATTPGVVSGFLALIGLTLASRRDGWSGNFAEAWESIDHDDRRLRLDRRPSHRRPWRHLAGRGRSGRLDPRQLELRQRRFTCRPHHSGRRNGDLYVQQQRGRFGSGHRTGQDRRSDLGSRARW